MTVSISVVAAAKQMRAEAIAGRRGFAGRVSTRKPLVQRSTEAVSQQQSPAHQLSAALCCAQQPERNRGDVRWSTNRKQA